MARPPAGPLGTKTAAGCRGTRRSRFLATESTESTEKHGKILFRFYFSVYFRVLPWQKNAFDQLVLLVMLISYEASDSAKTYPSGFRPSPAHPRRTGLPVPLPAVWSRFCGLLRGRCPDPCASSPPQSRG